MSVGTGRPGRRLILLATLGAVLVAVGGGASWVYHVLQGSLPRLDGETALPGLSAATTVERDALGVPTIRGQNRLDVARATGFLHGQERFFQMDLLRRAAAGELAELFGQGAVPTDKAVRVHRFRMRASRLLATLPKADQRLVEAYSDGVNAGLTALGATPFEYLVLREEPVAWRPEDSLLAIYAMYLRLQKNIRHREATLGLMEATLHPALYAFLAPAGTEWDAPLRGGPLEPPPLPGPEAVDLRWRFQADHPPMATTGHASDDAVVLGSNNWAVAGPHTAHGGAILANDMHLRIGVPNTWYRVALVYPDGEGDERRVTGVTLPGTPLIVVGSNGRVAWGFTNSEGDWSDLVVVEPSTDPQSDYMTSQGSRPFERHRETIRVKDAADESLDVLSTRWGPVVDRDHLGRRRVLRWIAHDPTAINFALAGLERAGGLPAALDIANRSGIPAQNFLAADASGRIGWTIAGPFPRRFGHDGRLPRSWADGSRGWNGWIGPAEYPRIVDPPSGRLWTANARVVDGAALARMGDGGYALGARARQIRDGLRELERPDEQELLKLQLDNRARFLARWRALLLSVLTPEAVADDSRRALLRERVVNEDLRAAVDSVAYPLVRRFRQVVARQVFTPLTAPCRRADPGFEYGYVRQQEGPLWRLVQERPIHLLDPRYATWQALLLGAVDTLLAEALGDDQDGLDHYTWGAFNRSRITHPLSPFLPGASRWLDMPDMALPGDRYMPRVQTPTAGASQRMVVSPGREAEGIFHMPGGQSGHPLSPHYRDGHAAWASGAPTPFLPGPPQHTLVLVPER